MLCVLVVWVLTCVHVVGAYCEQAAGKALSELKAAERCASGPCLHARSCQDLVSIPTLGFMCCMLV